METSVISLSRLWLRLGAPSQMSCSVLGASGGPQAGGGSQGSSLDPSHHLARSDFQELRTTLPRRPPSKRFTKTDALAVEGRTPGQGSERPGRAHGPRPLEGPRLWTAVRRCWTLPAGGSAGTLRNLFPDSMGHYLAKSLKSLEKPDLCLWSEVY